MLIFLQGTEHGVKSTLVLIMFYFVEARRLLPCQQHNIFIDMIFTNFCFYVHFTLIVVIMNVIIMAIFHNYKLFKLF